MQSNQDVFQDSPEKSEFKKILRRGDGLTDFLIVKTQFGRCKEEVTDIERRVKSLEELFHKQSIIQSSNEIVTTASLQNYLDALTTHIEKQFQDKVQVYNEQMQEALSIYKEDVRQMIKEKAPKQKVDRQLGHITKVVSDNEMRIDTIFNGLELSILKNVGTKAEMRDLEILDKAKANLSDVKQLENRFDRLEKQFNELEARGNETERDEEYGDELDDLIGEVDDQHEEKIKHEDLVTPQLQLGALENKDAGQVIQTSSSVPSSQHSPHAIPQMSKKNSPRFEVQPPQLAAFIQTKQQSNEDLSYLQEEPSQAAVLIKFSPQSQVPDSNVHRGEKTPHQSSISSYNDKSKFSRSKTLRKDSIMKSPTKKTDTDIEAIKSDFQGVSTKIKDIQMMIDESLKPASDFIQKYSQKILATMASQETNLKKIKEMESYDDSLKHKYLKSTLTSVNEIRQNIINNQTDFKRRAKESNEDFLSRFKTIEADVEYTKSNIELMRKIIQQHKFISGCNFTVLQTAQTSVSQPGEVSMNNQSISVSVDGGTHRSSLGAGNTVIQASVPHQMVVLGNQLAQLQADVEDHKQSTKTKLQQLDYEIEDMKGPMKNTVADLKRENDSFVRELDRFDGLYKKLFTEYMDSLVENKQILEKECELEKRMTQQSFINNATIQFFNSPAGIGQGILGGPSPLKSSTPLNKTQRTGSYLDQQFSLDAKMAYGTANGHMWKRRRMEATPEKIEALSTKVHNAQKKLKQLNHPEFVEISPQLKTFDVRASKNQQKASRTMTSSRVGTNDYFENGAPRTKFEAAPPNTAGAPRSKAGSSILRGFDSNSLEHKGDLPRTPNLQNRTSPGRRIRPELNPDAEVYLNGSISTPPQRPNATQAWSSSHGHTKGYVDTTDGESTHELEGRLNLKRFQGML